MSKAEAMVWPRRDVCYQQGMRARPHHWQPRAFTTQCGPLSLAFRTSSSSQAHGERLRQRRHCAQLTLVLQFALLHSFQWQHQRCSAAGACWCSSISSTFERLQAAGRWK